eukprot:m.31675 g.31675  ORF g.31675 m.31675 type:complete len:348 (-) comp10707_c0_seq1:92-1135(-)
MAAELPRVVSTLMVAAMAVALMGTQRSAATFIDDFTELDTQALRYLPQGHMWQSFNTSWESTLAEIRVYLGTQSPCSPTKSTLYLAAGVIRTFEAVKSSALTSVEVVTSCESATCVVKNPYSQCAAWQTFTLSTPIAVSAEQAYTFAIDVEPDDYELLPVMGVSPAAENHGGPSSLPRTTMFTTKYAQYTFQTYMTSARPNGDDLDQQTVVPTSQEPATTDFVEDSNSSNKQTTKIGVAGIVVPVVVVLVIICSVAFIVVQRRRWARDKVIDSSRLYAIAQEEDDYMFHSGAEDAQSDTRSVRRHPINVRSSDSHIGHEDANRWADRSWTYSAYSRKLPSVPVDSEC